MIGKFGPGRSQDSPPAGKGTKSDMKKPHYAFIICLMCVWMYVGNMGLNSNLLTTYLPFIEEAGLEESLGSALVSVRSLFSFLTMFGVEYYYRRLSLRKGLFFTGLIGVLSALVFSIGGSAPVYFAGAALGGIGYALGSIYPAALLLNNWFHTHRGLALGISSAGTGLSMMLFGPLFSSVILRYSLKTAFYLHAAIMLVSSFLFLLIIRDRPSDLGMKAYGDGEESVSETVKEDLRDKAPLTKPLLFLLGLMMLLSGGAGQSFSSHLSVLARSCGYSAAQAAAAVSLFGFFLSTGKLSAGELADRFGMKRCSVLLISLFILGCLSVYGMNGTNMFLCLAPSVILGFSASVFNIGPPIWSSDLAPAEDYSRTLRFLQIFYTFGGILFPVIPGIIAEHTGEYKSSYLLFGMMMAVKLVILLYAYHWAAGHERKPASAQD